MVERKERVELDKAVIEKHSIPWYDHNRDRGDIVLESSGKVEGLRETFSVIKLAYNRETEMLRAVLDVLEEDGDSERTVWLIPRSQVKFMSREHDGEGD